ncbi:ferrous iron transport protein B [Lunatimonas salinarum]|uniref:ferrous iron transport protein B n=1 Tax=Lunatimonas salinarum TaxID=1774590 RepID=UPI001FD7EB13|nr:ferrous iron transport protein B [Lunatimonas salinarum]
MLIIPEVMDIVQSGNRVKSIAIIGNPNVGKSSIFNHLTGLNQKIGNYPGVTVDKMVGTVRQGSDSYQLIDLPGTYSLYPKSEDEEIAHRVLNGLGEERPDFVLVILDACNLERSLLLGTQVMDLGIPMAFLVNMKDLAERNGVDIKVFELYKQLGVPLILTDARKSEGIESIKELIFSNRFEVAPPLIDVGLFLPAALTASIKDKYCLKTAYQAFQMLVFSAKSASLSGADRLWLCSEAEKHGVDLEKLQVAETVKRYQRIAELLRTSVVKRSERKSGFTLAFDRVMLHPIFGYLVFLAIMLLVFQAIFAWAELPMDWIDVAFASLGATVYEALPAGVFTDLLAEGVIPGIGGVVIFIPQIALLFGFLAFLEDTGYLSRVVFLMDRIMKPFGLHGKSVVPLISGMACAIPGIMAARNISSNKERLITILVTPWMSCSARLPVYIILIGLTVSSDPVWGINMQAIALLFMYLLGIAATFLGALALKFVLKKGQKSYLICDLPIYRMPRWKAVFLTMFGKSKVFVLEAGKVIFSISIILWVLASYGPNSRMDPLRLEKEAAFAESAPEEMDEVESFFASKELENSYIGIMGKAIEPAIRPLGYDWKIGIALITSFAAREVFVATIATIYSIGGDIEDELTIREKLSLETRPDTGEKVFDRATGFSLMVFYAFAMQCMSTLAVVYRETKSWKWPLLQTVIMTVVAYLAALFTYQLFS